MEMKHGWRPRFSRRPANGCWHGITRAEWRMMFFALAVFFVTAALKG